jgi:predicted nucleic acid-binding protein
VAEQWAASAPLVVLDTNAVLDWLVFGDPRIQPVVVEIEAGRLVWIACAAMRQELVHMLGHTSLTRWSPDALVTLARFDRLAAIRPAPPGNPHTRLRCSDADDQVFIDLALTEGADWLLTHDRALLKLARRASARGLRILRPGDWTPQT